MTELRNIILSFGMLIVISSTATFGKSTLSDLTEGQRIAAFETEAVYLNQNNQRVGARFRHIPSRFVLDIMRIQSLPQAFMWVNTPPPTDQGEPHTLEHLLLGKGTKGRYVASLEDMSLGRSSAFTQQLRTCYHYNTSAGAETFFDLFYAKLDAMIHPNYSDEEIRREVRNMGITVNSDDGSNYLEEKGTVYNEMVSSFERPWGNLYFNLLKLVYGDNHPLSYSAGGYPAALRTMQPKDIREFQQAYYHLNNMGAVVSIGDEIALEDCLSRLSEIFSEIESGTKADVDPADYASSIPEPSHKQYGQIRTVSFPHQNENEPGLLVYAWPAERELYSEELLLFEVFIENLASGQTSNLYKKFINSQTRLLDIGASSSFGWISDHPGHALFIGFNNVSREMTDEAMIDSVRSLIMADIKDVATFEDNSDELKEFNERVRSLVINRRRGLNEFLNKPPGFGVRGTGSRWLDHLQLLQKTGGFERDLSMQGALAFAEELLDSKKNFWNKHIESWKLLETKPFGLAARPDPKLLADSERERKERIGDFISQLKKQFGAASDESAISAYEKEYTRNTEIIDAETASIEMPSFVKSPPLTLDDQLHYTVEELPGGGSCVLSEFNNITSTTIGLVFDLYAVPESLLVFVPALPTVITELGVIKDGQPVSFDEMSQAIRREILELDAYFSTNYRTERVELTVRAAGSDKTETDKALGWLSAALFEPDLRLENLPRIRDAVDLRLKSLRNRMRGSEESWVNEPMYAFWRQHNPLLLSARCFLTQAHSMHRLRWMLKDAGGEKQLAFVDRFIDLVSQELSNLSRQQAKEFLDGLTASGKEFDPALPLATMLDSAPGNAKGIIVEAIKDLKLSLSDIPDNSLSQDLAYLCRQIVSDLRTPPQKALTSFTDLLKTIRHQVNVRGFIVSSNVGKDEALSEINNIVSRLDKSTPKRYEYNGSPLIAHRLEQRLSGVTNPICVGLVNENTRSGVHNNTADCASLEDFDEQTLLKFLSARLYGGGGAHSMFMKTWGAGLAYSNGLRSNESDGRLIYYAERCPDLTQTMRFVIDQLKNAPYDPSLADYAVSQGFAGIRSGATYEHRGEAMAADLEDGLTPDVVRRFRQGILDLRKQGELYDKLHNLMPATYGEVLPGYGTSCQEAAEKSNAIYFVIGPEKQLATYEDYLSSVDPEVTLYRIYPRDFWISSE